ncbi:MAG: nucleotidyltransferase substrate binding protein [Ignavibacteriaceae bacterium]|nr:nucleotidyltransferase substrate binding protein [Ignavibacteriaceae bacterium]
MNGEDIRWKQRFSNLKKAFMQLERFIDKTDLNDLEKQGLIQVFEYTYELSWNTIKDYYEYQGESGIQGSRDAFRLAIKIELVKEDQLWMDMIQSRQKTAHTYNEKTANKIAARVTNDYFGLFKDLVQSFKAIENEEDKIS